MTSLVPQSLLSHVNPFIGIEAGGSCLVGPYRPLGMVRPGPQAYAPDAVKVPNNGWSKSAPIRRFAQVHVSGSGGGGRYGNVAIAPYHGPRSFDWPCHDYSAEKAEPGYYGVTLAPNGIRTEITSTARCAHYRFRFEQASSKNPGRLLMDGAAALGGSSTHARDGYCNMADSRRAYGWVTLLGGWGHHHPFQLFFYIEFDRDTVGRRFCGEPCGQEPHAARGADLRFDLDFGATRELECRIGISFVSVAKARRNLERELGGKTFETVRRESEVAWLGQLERVRVDGGTSEETMLHYTMLHRLLAMPGDLGVDDEFPLWHSGVRQFNDFFCLWDSCRNANGFLGLCYAPLQRDFVNCLVDVGKHTGWLFDAWISFHHGFQQGGCSADLLLSEAALRHLPGINYTEALRLARQHFESEPEDPARRGRYLREWQEAGYVSTKLNERQFGCVSRQIEYSYHDHCLGLLARSIGDEPTARICFENARKVLQLWHPEKRCFFPKDHEGRWVADYDITQVHPDASSHATDPYFFEGTAVEWALCPLHLMEEVIAGHGGPEAFVAHLDDFFASKMRMWKEIILHTPYLYHEAGRPDKSADQVRAQRRRYHTGRDGIPDNEDMGSNSTFVIASGIGLYPVMGQDRYWLSPPRFREVELTAGMEGRKLRIVTEGADPAGATTYITKASLNGQPLDRAWVKHDELVRPSQDSELRLTLSSQPNDWGRRLR